MSGPLPCLAITTKEITNPELKVHCDRMCREWLMVLAFDSIFLEGLWKAMDQDMPSPQQGSFQQTCVVSHAMPSGLGR